MKEALEEDIRTAVDRTRPFLENPETAGFLKVEFLSKRAGLTRES